MKKEKIFINNVTSHKFSFYKNKIEFFWKFLTLYKYVVILAIYYIEMTLEKKWPLYKNWEVIISPSKNKTNMQNTWQLYDKSHWSGCLLEIFKFNVFYFFIWIIFTFCISSLHLSINFVFQIYQFGFVISNILYFKAHWK